MGNKLSRSKNLNRDDYEAVCSARLATDDLIERIASLEIKIKDGDQITTPLIIAARNGNMDSVKKLLKFKADIEARGTVEIDDEVIEGCTPLWAAAATGHLDVVELLIERNADVDGRTITNSTPLRAAAYDGRLDIVRCLVENGADVNARNNFENTPLMVACYNGHINVVTYLIERNANMDLQDKQGNTVLHYAVKRGHFEIANKLLALGVSQLPNIQRLTPLLLASNDCKIEMVEYFIKRPECTKEQRIDGLELLGATIANECKVNDIEKAFSYMKRGMEERFQDQSHPLLKKQMEPLEVYQNRKESQTLEELVLLEGDAHAIHMEGLIIRERILGTDNTELRHPIRYRGAVFADSNNFDLCIGLWGHAMEIGHRCNQPVTGDIEFFVGVFGDMVQNNCLLRPMLIEGVFEKLVSECERLTKKSQSNQKATEREANSLKDEQEKMFYCALYLLMIYSKVQVPENRENVGIFDLIQRFRCLNLRTHDGNTLLHLAAWYKTPIKDEFVRRACKLPCVETMKLLIHAGSDVNAMNTKGETPLHLAVTLKPNPEQLQILQAMLEVLLDTGADTDQADCNGETALDIAVTNEARRILSEKRELDVTPYVRSRSNETPSVSLQEPAEESVEEPVEEPVVEPVEELVQQCTEMCPFSDVIKVTVLSHKWCFPFSAFSYLSRELAIQLAKHPQVKVSVLVPQKSLTEEEKNDVHSYGITAVEAQPRPGFPDPLDWLNFPPKSFVTDVVIALNDKLGQIAHVVQEQRQCRRIQVVYSLSEDPGAVSARDSKRKHQTNVGLCEGADLAVAIGSKLADELAASLRYCNKHVVTLIPGLISDLSNVRQASHEGSKFRILVLSGDGPADFYQDRLDIAAKALAELKDKTCHLMFVGVAEEKEEELFKLCGQCGVARQQLTIRSFPRSDEDLGRLFCEADLGILLSTSEGSSLIALGALSAGLPVIASGDSGFAEALKVVPFGTTVLVDTEDAEEWADAIKEVKKTDRKTRLQQAGSLRSRYDEKHSWENQCGALVEKILTMCQGEQDQPS